MGTTSAREVVKKGPVKSAKKASAKKAPAKKAPAKSAKKVPAKKAPAKKAPAKSAKKASAKKVPAKKASAKKGSRARRAHATPEAYVASLAPEFRDVVERVRAIVREEAPSAKESLKWGQPVWEQHGPFAYVRAFASSVNLGFFQGALLEDPEGLLLGEGVRMRHVRLSVAEAMREDAIRHLVRQAVAVDARGRARSRI